VRGLEVEVEVVCERGAKAGQAILLPRRFARGNDGCHGRCDGPDSEPPHFFTLQPNVAVGFTASPSSMRELIKAGKCNFTSPLYSPSGGLRGAERRSLVMRFRSAFVQHA